jgi:ribosomal-protein-alanine N-acetyltransferase
MNIAEKNNSITIRHLRAEDAGAVFYLERITMPLPWSEAALRIELERDVTTAFGAYSENRLIGYILLWQVLDQVEIARLGVDLNYRRKGVARQLWQRAVDHFSTTGAHEVWLEVRESNSAARNFYLSCGLEDAGRRCGYYTDTLEDALTMRLRL